MKLKIFADTNLFIYSFEYPESNSAKIIELLNNEEIECVTSEKVLKEVGAYFLKFYSVEHARKFRRYILDSCFIVMNADVTKEINLMKGQIKDKDIEQIAVVRKYGLKFLVSYDRDFEEFEEYITPKKFIIQMGINSSDTEF